jgi:hypothetical protein
VCLFALFCLCICVVLFVYLCCFVCLFALFCLFVLFFVYLCCFVCLFALFCLFMRVVFLFICCFVYLCCFVFTCVVLFVSRVVLLLIVTFCVLFACKCVLNYCHRLATQLQLTNISISINNCILENAILYHFKRFIKYYPDDDPSGPKHVAVKSTKNKAVLTVVCLLTTVCRFVQQKYIYYKMN